jgi:hypothetical protein
MLKMMFTLALLVVIGFATAFMLLRRLDRTMIRRAGGNEPAGPLYPESGHSAAKLYVRFVPNETSVPHVAGFCILSCGRAGKAQIFTAIRLVGGSGPCRMLRRLQHRKP